MSFTPYPARRATEITSLLEGPKLITFVGGTSKEPVTGILELKAAKLSITVGAGLFLPRGARLNLGGTACVVSYESQD